MIDRNVEDKLTTAQLAELRKKLSAMSVHQHQGRVKRVGFQLV
jgi:hypothetical protein